MKKLILILSVTIMCMVWCTPATAVSVESNTARSSVRYTIDNDTIDSRYSNTRYGFSIYYEGSQHYNGDARRTASANKNHRYGWVGTNFYTPKKELYVTIGMYLNSSLFTDSRTGYWSNQGIDSFLIGRKNQNTAPAGWSYMNGVLDKNYATVEGIPLKGIDVAPSGTGSGYTGADAISVYAYD